MMKKILLFATFFLGFYAIQEAQVAAEKPVESSQKTLNESALLWEISGNDLESPSFLFGTIHMIGKEDYALPDGFKNAFGKVNRITFEINMEDMTDFNKMMPLMMQAFMKNDTTLKDLLNDEEYTIVEKHFEKVGLPLMFLDRIKPMFLSALTSEDLLTMQSQPGEVVSYEMELMSMAKEEEKEIGGLETAEYQMSLFDSIPYRVQAKMLLQAIQENSGSDQDEFDELVNLYKTQDIEGMQKMMKADEEGIGRYENLLLINRNLNWIPVMQNMMMQSPTLFAVGAGHLGGEKGVINLLREAGYQLTPIKK